MAASQCLASAVGTILRTCCARGRLRAAARDVAAEPFQMLGFSPVEPVLIGPEHEGCSPAGRHSPGLAAPSVCLLEHCCGVTFMTAGTSADALASGHSF